MHNDEPQNGQADGKADRPARSPSPRRGRAILLAVALVLLAALLAYYAYWRIAAQQLEAGIEAWAEQERARGNEVAFAWDGIGGFPLRFAATFHGPALRWHGPRGEIEWRGTTLSAAMAPWNLRRIEVQSADAHDAALRTAGGGEWRVGATGLGGTIALHGTGALRSATIALQQPDLTLPDGAVLSSAAATVIVEQPATPPADYTMPLARLALEARSIALPDGTRLLTEDPVEALSFDATVKGPVPMAPLTDALAAWRDAGGVIDLTSFAMQQGALKLSGNATLALDAALQPQGAGTVTASGLEEAVEILIRDGLIPPDRALVSRATVKALQKEDPDGTREATFGLSLQNRTVSFGPVPLFALQPIEWP